jgi:hypothetical protein
MFTEKWLAIIGAFLLAAGMFLPVWHDSAGGPSLNLIDVNSGNGIEADGPGVYILILAAVTILLLVMERPEYTWVTTLVAFLSLFAIFSNLWGLAINDRGSLRIGWSAILGGLILMSAPFWPEPLKTWLEMGPGGDTLEENPEPVEEDEA